MLMLELMLCVSCCWRYRCVLWTLKKDKETPAFPSQYLSFIKLVGDTGSSAAETAKTGHMLVTMHVGRWSNGEEMKS